VILSWTASAPGDAKHADADGYCVYRAERKDDRALVRVNLKAFRGTSCTDDRVPTGTTYYYKVKAVSRDGTRSEATDFATASLLDPKPSKPSGNPPPPVCWDSD
jgi:fibronectin type 3 domain-containing protein